MATVKNGKVIKPNPPEEKTEQEEQENKNGAEKPER